MPSWPVSSCLVEGGGHGDRRQAAGGGGGGGGEQKKITGPVRSATARQQASLPVWQAGGRGRYRRLPHKPARGSASLPATLATRDSDCRRCAMPRCFQNMSFYTLHLTLCPQRRSSAAICSPPFTRHCCLAGPPRCKSRHLVSVALHPSSACGPSPSPLLRTPSLIIASCLGPALPPAHDASGLAPRHIHHPSSSYPLHLV
jgi:hypothetical protein